MDVLAIAFNHDPLSARTSALNLRQNQTRFVTVPEWQRGLPAASPVAYAIADTAGSTISIRAKLAIPEHAEATVEIRAIPAPAPPIPESVVLAAAPPWALTPLEYAIARWYLEVAWRQQWGLNADILGEVAATPVEVLADGTTDFAEFKLVSTRLQERGVGAHRASWLWQCRTGEGRPWRDITTTSHQVYTLITVPTAPWVQFPYDSDNTQLPWAEVLEWACMWAAGSTTPEVAASAINVAVYEFGAARLDYGCLNGAPSNYSYPAFDCTAFLQRLRDGFGNGPFVNCSDCATIVSTFANSVGCDLWQAQMFDSLQAFPVNPVKVIGDTAFRPVCGIGLFNYHEVAWTDACDVDDQVFDACLEVGLLAPFEPTIPLLPSNLTFGRPGSGGYRDRLAAPAGRLLCRPRPESRTRRFVY